MSHRTATTPATVIPPSALQSLIQGLIRWRMLWIILATLLLSGCVRYEVGVNFESPNRGTIVQHIRLDERLNSTAQAWLANLEKRVRTLEGKTRRTNQEILVTIPFGNAEDLEAKFNEFFGADDRTPKSRVAQKDLDLPKIESRLQVKQGNFLLVQRQRLIYDLDLRSLGVLSPDGSLLLSPGSLIELEFGLTTPWGARSTQPASTGSAPVVHQAGKQLVWVLQPGQSNHLEAVFWLPNPLGIGTVVIALAIAAGLYLKRNAPTPIVSESAEA